MDNLNKLIEAYNKAPEIFQAGRYWKNYEDEIINEIKKANFTQLKSGKYPIFSTFGFAELIYNSLPNMPLPNRLAKQFFRKLFISDKAILPYSLKLSDIREMAYNNCVLQGQLAGVRCISEIEASTYGNPEDLFRINGKQYTMRFLTYYIRFCFVQRHLKLTGNETIVELGSGSGLQVEVLKKLYPDLTILCFDLPAPLYLCEEYLSKVLAADKVVKSDTTLQVTNLNNFIQKGKVHLFGNWLFPLLNTFKFDLFWNAASFGEMEPDIVKNYLSYVQDNCDFVYLLQVRNGKESSEQGGVKNPMTFDFYNAVLTNFKLIKEADAFEAHRRQSQSGGYFQAVWQNKNTNSVQ